ncbi:protein AMBP-like isoform X2 [Dermacentor variabilis]|uniref:protein AMBP-like isoform X2 n=1 Tax=Dermacentor variabilis TaxID=34621 RepID=UPI003F5BA12E
MHDIGNKNCKAINVMYVYRTIASYAASRRMYRSISWKPNMCDQRKVVSREICFCAEQSLLSHLLPPCTRPSGSKERIQTISLQTCHNAQVQIYTVPKKAATKSAAVTGRAQKETHCLRLPLIGTCEPVLQTWHHDRDKRICKRLNYTICSLGTKEFATEEMCLITCLRIKPKVLCSLKPRSEPCMGRSRTWYFDLGSNSCHRFPSGRCAANDNGFTSRQKCLARCSYEK